MSHVDEGLLNALLDGELDADRAAKITRHVDACAACGNLFTQAKQARDRAAAILDGAGMGAVDVPPFPQLVERARAKRTRRQYGRINRLQGLAWAATLVLAVGVGWYARGRVGFEQPIDSPVAPDSLARRTTPISADARRPEVPVEREREPLDLEEQPPAAAPQARDAVERAPALVPAAPPAQQSPPSLVSKSEPLDPGRVETELVPTAVADRERPLDRLSLATPAVDAAPTIRGFRASWRPTSETEAQAFVGGRLARVDGLTVLMYAVSTAEGTPRVTRITQQLPSGDAIEIFQTRSEGLADTTARRDRAEQDNAIAARDATTALTQVWGDYLITLRAALPAESLRVLFGKLR